MRLVEVFIAALCVLFVPALLAPSPGGGAVIGSVTFTGTPAKTEPINMAKEPDCVKLHAKPLMTEKVVTGPGNALQNVVVYISAGVSDNSAVPATPVSLDQQGCHYTTHVLAFRAGQDVKISNSDPFSHNIHPTARINREVEQDSAAGNSSFFVLRHKEPRNHNCWPPNANRCLCLSSKILTRNPYLSDSSPDSLHETARHLLELRTLGTSLGTKPCQTP